MDTTRPPRDGWIQIKGGQSVMFDIQKDFGELNRLHTWLSQVRGMVLSASYNIESALDVAITEFFFPEFSSTGSNKRIEVFQDNFLRSSDARLYRKIKVFMKVVDSCPDVSEMSAPIKSDLNSVRSLRNKIAHDPTSVVPMIVENENRVDRLALYLHARGEPPLEITTTIVSEWIELLNRTLKCIEDVNRTLTKSQA